MRRVAPLALAACVMTSPALASGAPSMVRVGLLRYHPPAALDVACDGAWTVSGGQQAIALPARSHVQVTVAGHGLRLWQGRHPVLAAPRLRLASEAAWTLTAGPSVRRCRGQLALSTDGKTILPVLALPLEDYVVATTGDEMPADWPAAALAAQGVAARSYAVAMRGRHAAEGYDFCDLTHCQLFHGLASSDPRVAAAVGETRGRVLVARGRAIAAVWHSTCAGHTLPNDEVFGGERVPYLAGGPDLRADGRPWCADSPHASAWQVAYAVTDLAAALHEARVLAPTERLRDLRVLDASSTGVPLSVEVLGNRPHLESGYGLWMALGPHFGWGELKGPRFTLRRAGARFAFQGRGLGHLVGMCQWGARGRALAGRTWQEILAAYYPGTRLSAWQGLESPSTVSGARRSF